MFILYALIFLTVNGVAATEPTATLGNKTKFASEELCMNYFDTDAGATSRQGLKEMADAMGQPYRLEFKCAKAPGLAI